MLLMFGFECLCFSSLCFALIHFKVHLVIYKSLFPYSFSKCASIFLNTLKSLSNSYWPYSFTFPDSCSFICGWFVCVCGYFDCVYLCVDILTMSSLTFHRWKSFWGLGRRCIPPKREVFASIKTLDWSYHFKISAWFFCCLCNYTSNMNSTRNSGLSL